MDNYLIARVAIDQAVYRIDKPYDYLLPKSLNSGQIIGCRVLVPFGNGNATRQGLVVDTTNECDYDKSKLKSVISVLDETPILDRERLLLANYLKQTTFCTYFDALRVLLPLGISLKLEVSYKLSSSPFCNLTDDEEVIVKFLQTKNDFISREKLLNLIGHKRDSQLLENMFKKGILLRNDTASRRIKDASVKMIELSNYDTSIKLTQKQQSVIQKLQEVGKCSVKELCYFTGVTLSVINTLANKGVVNLFEQEYYRTPILNNLEDKSKIVLTEEQNNAFARLVESYNNGFSTNLLYGVTGSGKTQVFLKMADYIIEKGKSVIVLVPEIALTPQTISIFNKRYGNKVALLHSGMSLSQRTDEWRRINNGEAKVVVGTRSAIFAPVKNIGLIIIDEEQEHTYKSEQTPKYHARDVAKFRAKYHNALLILASATPSIESYTNAKIGKYNLNKLTKRYGNAHLPEVKTVDMRTELFEGNKSPISRELENAINGCLERGEQAILLMNRRGHNTLITCSECGEVATCPNCSISLNYHSANGRLMCHYCGYSVENTYTCVKCGSKHVRYLGIGTQRIEEELQEKFPNANILRMDADTTFKRESYEKNLTAFARGEYNIMLGTQMVAKGLDFPKVTLVGVLSADSSLYSMDYRSFERSFSLLTQVVGRSGRGDKSGTALIQTVQPDNEIIRLAANQDYDSFYEQEISMRKLMIYPPYCDIAMVVVNSVSREGAHDSINSFYNILVNKLNNSFKDVKVNILGPTIANVPKVNNKYRFRLIIKFRGYKRFGELINEALHEFYNLKHTKIASITIDINPESII